MGSEQSDLFLLKELKIFFKSDFLDMMYDNI